MKNSGERLFGCASGEPPMTEQLAAGLCSARLTDRSFARLPCLFLDRDGVIVEETNYLHRIEDVSFIEGVSVAVARANAMSIPVVMVTNQAGIGRGLYGWDDFHAVQQHIYARFADDGAHFDMVLACAYHPEGVDSYAVADHAWRKPRPGMLREAHRILGIDLSQSFIVGDTLADLSAGRAAGLRAGALVGTGHGDREWREKAKLAFAQWAADETFVAERFSDAGVAIGVWLDRLIATSRR